MRFSHFHVWLSLISSTTLVLGNGESIAQPKLAVSAPGQSYSITQVRNPNYQDALVDYAQHYSQTLRKFNPAVTPPGDAHDIEKRSANLTGFPTGNALWAFPLALGTPPQLFHVVLDTGSTGFWVFSTETHTTAKNHAFYAPAASSTARRFAGQTFVSTYGSGSAAGNVYQDRLGVGSLIVSNFFTGSAVNVTSWFETYFIDGVLGLDMDALDAEQPTRESSFLQVLNKSGTSIFSVDFNHAAPSTITFGAIPSTWHNITYLPSNPQTFGYLWTVNLTSISINNNHNYYNHSKTPLPPPPSPRAPPLPIILDTGTNYIALPDALAAAYYAHVPLASNSSGLWEFPCGTPLPSWGFGVAGGSGGSGGGGGAGGAAESWNIPGVYLSLTSLVGGKTCIGVIQGGAGGRPVLGVPAFEAVGVVFDFAGQRVGFALKG